MKKMNELQKKKKNKKASTKSLVQWYNKVPQMLLIVYTQHTKTFNTWEGLDKRKNTLHVEGMSRIILAMQHTL